MRTPYIYQGEEIGWPAIRLSKHWIEVEDIESLAMRVRSSWKKVFHSRKSWTYRADVIIPVPKYIGWKQNAGFSTGGNGW